MKLPYKATLAATLIATTFFANADMIQSDFSNASSLSDWQLNGSAANYNPNANNALILTAFQGDVGSAFTNQTFSLANDASFSAAFNFNIESSQGFSDQDGGGGSTADGFVFTLQGIGSTALGMSNTMGYAGIGNSLGIEFDNAYQSYADSTLNPHFGINLNGAYTSTYEQDFFINFSSAFNWYSWIDYDGVNDLLEVRISNTNDRPDTAFFSYNIDIASEIGTSDVHVGFTADSVSSNSQYKFGSFSMNTVENNAGITSNNVSSPLAISLLGVILFGISAYRRRR